MDGSEKVQQKSGFSKQLEAKKARDQTIGELTSGNYIVFGKVKVKDFLQLWLEDDIKTRAGSYNTYYSFSNVVKNHILPEIGNKAMVDVNRGDIQRLYVETAEKSESVAKQVNIRMWI